MWLTWYFLTVIGLDSAKICGSIIIVIDWYDTVHSAKIVKIGEEIAQNIFFNGIYYHKELSQFIAKTSGIKIMAALKII